MLLSVKVSVFEVCDQTITIVAAVLLALICLQKMLLEMSKIRND